jgi:Kef-type K+ transport system membrane component KefB/mannitol/fructose-specific phosphotransferase system IIA component (Ntr-type)/nucleotide-binding universal stress UspA family protein
VTLPVTDPVLIVAAAMAIFLVAPLLMRRIRLPALVGLILAGALVGPQGLGILARDPTIVLLGTVGLLYLVFLAGLELDLHRFVDYRRQSLIFGTLSFLVPTLLAIVVMPLLGFSMPASFLIGAIVGSHTLLTYPIVSRLGLLKNAAVTTVVGGTLVTDTLSLTVLAVVSGTVAGDATPAYWVSLFGVLGAYAAGVLLLVPKLGRWFFRKAPGEAPVEFIFLMVVLFTSAYLARAAGAQPIIGAFLAGLTLNRLIPNQGALMHRVRFVGNALFIPFFLISVGMLVNVRVLAGSVQVWTIAIALLAFVLGGKWGAARLGQRIFGYSRDEGQLMFGLSAPQAAATLAVTFVGLELGLFGDDVVNAVIVLILVTALVGPLVTERYGRKLAARELQRPYEPTEAPQRILIPVSNPATADALLDLAFMLRNPRSDEPILPLMVVREEVGPRSAAMVAEAERMLGHAVLYAAGADVPVLPQTRVDQNIAAGILRGIAETRTTTVVIGWDGRSSTRQRVFGGVLDQLLEQSREMILVAKLGHALNTTRRIILILPPLVSRHPGFLKAVHSVKTLADQLGCPVVALVVHGHAGRYRELVDPLPPKVPTTWNWVRDWPDLPEALRIQLEADDLVIAIGARRGTVAWHRSLEALPAELAALAPESFLVVYPPEPAVSFDETSELRLPALEPERVVLDIPAVHFADVLAVLVERAFPGDAIRQREVVATLAGAERDLSSQLRPGVVVPHTGVQGLERTIVVVGISRQGVEFPNTPDPARAIILVLSRADDPTDHLRQLEDLTSLAREPDRFDRLIASSTPAEVILTLREGVPV